MPLWSGVNRVPSLTGKTSSSMNLESLLTKSLISTKGGCFGIPGSLFSDTESLFWQPVISQKSVQILGNVTAAADVNITEHINFLAVNPTMTVTAFNSNGGTSTATFDATSVDCLGRIDVTTELPIATLTVNYRAGKPLSENTRVLIQPYLPPLSSQTDDDNWIVTPVSTEGFDLVLTLIPAAGITEFSFAYFII
jgi:hypothetical protein